MLRILIVDDSISAQLKIKTILSNYGQCDQAYNGKEAVDHFQLSLKNNSVYDLIIMDIVMPEMDGLTAVKKIKEIQDKEEIAEEDRTKIIMLTSKKDSENMMKAHYELGISVYVTKPFEEKTLIESLGNLDLIENPIDEFEQ